MRQEAVSGDGETGTTERHIDKGMDASVEYHGSVVDNYKQLIREQDEELRELRKQLRDVQVRGNAWCVCVWEREDGREIYVEGE